MLRVNLILKVFDILTRLLGAGISTERELLRWIDVSQAAAPTPLAPLPGGDGGGLRLPPRPFSVSVSLRDMKRAAPPQEAGGIPKERLIYLLLHSRLYHVLRHTLDTPILLLKDLTFHF